MTRIIRVDLSVSPSLRLSVPSYLLHPSSFLLSLRLLRDTGTWIIPDRLLACSYPRRPRLQRALAAHGITTVLNLHDRPHPAPYRTTSGLTEIHLPVPDFTPPSPDQLAEGVRAIQTALARGERVAVHCGAGLGRTGTLIACYLVSTGLSLAAAIAEVRRLRPGSIETKAQETAVHAFIPAPRSPLPAPSSGTPNAYPTRTSVITRPAPPRTLLTTEPAARRHPVAHPNIELLTAAGQSLWQDDIARSMLTSGALERMIEETGIRGLTSNPTIFEKAISSGDAYDEQILKLLDAGKTASEIFEAVEIQDLQAACDLFRPLYDSTDGADGFCSIEVFPDAARNRDSTREQARHLWAEVGRPNLMVKIPGTEEATPVIREMLASGININVTLLFSLASYERVALAYVEALEDRHERGEKIDRVASVASFFVSRVDVLVDKLLDDKIAAGAGDAVKLEALKGKIAVANARLAYAKYQEIFEGERFAPLAAAGGMPQRPLWASTGVKNPAYPDTLYVDTLIGPNTVNTMPGKTIEAFLDHGTVARTVDQGVDEARRQMADLHAAGIDIDAVTHQLEEEGIASFVKSFGSLIAGVEGKKNQIAEAVGAST